MTRRNATWTRFAIDKSQAELLVTRATRKRAERPAHIRIFYTNNNIKNISGIFANVCRVILELLARAFRIH